MPIDVPKGVVMLSMKSFLSLIAVERQAQYFGGISTGETSEQNVLIFFKSCF